MTSGAPQHPKAICEPVDLAAGQDLLAERVERRGAPAPERFVHYHDAAELVIYRRAAGHMAAAGGTFAVEPQSVTFVASMRTHDFEVAGGDHSWILVRLDPYLVETVAGAMGGGAPLAAFTARLPDAEFERAWMLGLWLVEACSRVPPDGSHAVPAADVARLLLGLCLRAERRPMVETAGGMDGSDRLSPALERLRAHPGRVLSVADASAACNLSPAYFCRRFKQMSGQSFGEYARNYRLHLAA